MIESPVKCELADSSDEKTPIDIHIQLCSFGFVEVFEVGPITFWYDIRNVDNWILRIWWFGQNNL